MKQKRFLSIFLGLLLALQLFAVFQFASCGGLADGFRFSPYDLELRLIESIHNDQGVPIWEVRAFHNKVIGTTFDIFGAYLHFWNLSFLTQFLSLAGVVGLGAGFYAFIAQKKKRLVLSLLLLCVLLVPFLEILGATSLSYLLRLGLIVGLFVIWSMYGYWYLLKEKKINTWWIIALLVVSLWYQFVMPLIGKICVV